MRSALRLQNISRKQAVVIHFFCSAIVFLIPLSLITLCWFPSFYFLIDGGWQGVRLIVACHLILGPLLTLIIFKPGKKGLWLDVSFIAIVQLAALSFGTSVVYQNRAVGIAFSHDTFYTINPITFKLAQTSPQTFYDLPGNFPKMAFIDLPPEKEARKALLRDQSLHGLLYAKPERIRPFRDHTKTVIAWGARSIDDLIAINPTAQSELNTWLQQHNRDKNNTGLIPILARYGARYFYVDMQSADILSMTSRAIQPPF